MSPKLCSGVNGGCVPVESESPIATQQCGTGLFGAGGQRYGLQAASIATATTTTTAEVSVRNLMVPSSVRRDHGGARSQRGCTVPVSVPNTSRAWPIVSGEPAIARSGWGGGHTRETGHHPFGRCARSVRSHGEGSPRADSWGAVLCGGSARPRSCSCHWCSPPPRAGTTRASRRTRRPLRIKASRRTRQPLRTRRVRPM